MTPSPFNAPDNCANCRGRRLCSYHEGWMDALDVARVRELHAVVDAAEHDHEHDHARDRHEGVHRPCVVCAALDDLREVGL